MAKALLLSIPAAAKALGVSERTVYRRVTIGQYPTRPDALTGNTRIAISHLRKAIIEAAGSEEYERIKAALEKGENPFPAASKPAKRPVKKAPAKTKAKKVKK